MYGLSSGDSQHGLGSVPARLLFADLRDEVVLQAQSLDQVDLRFQPIDVLFGLDQNLFEQVAAASVVFGDAQLDGCVVRLDPAGLECEVVLELLLNVGPCAG